MTRIVSIVAALAFVSSVALAEEGQPSRFTYRSIDAGTADDLAKRQPVGKVIVVKAEPLVGNARRTTSTDSTSTSNLTGSTGIAKKTAETATRSMTAPVQFAAPLRAAAASQQAVHEETVTNRNAVVADRSLVDRNAAFTKAYHDAYPSAPKYEPTTVSGNTYGTRSPACYHGRVVYGSYAHYHTGYYRPRTYVTTTYCAPTYRYYTPTYYTSYSSHCYPSYRTYYRGSYCSTPRFYVRPSVSFHYGYSRGYCGGGSRWGFSIGF